jgi:hypothetical protein
MTVPTPTPVLDILHRIYDQHEASPSWSWDRLNHGLRQTLSALILVGTPFALDDFQRLARDSRLAFGHWCGADGSDMTGERLYRLAVTENNLSACLAFEAWKQRPPFILNGGRLYVGAKALWHDERCTCTSFTRDGTTVVLCSYHPHMPDDCPTCWRSRTSYEAKVRHRYRLTWQDLHPTATSGVTRRRRQETTKEGHV